MVKTVKEVGPHRYRETFGRYFEEFQVGDVYEHRPGKTVLESDNHLFTLLTLNTHPLHFDAEYGRATEFGRNLVVSTYTLALLIGMSVSAEPPPNPAAVRPAASPLLSGNHLTALATVAM